MCKYILREYLGIICSSVHIFGEMSCNTLLFVLSVGVCGLFLCGYVYVIFYNTGYGNARESISICCVVYVMKYGLFHVPWLSWW